MTRKSDHELLNGDSDDFGELYQKYHRGVKAFLHLQKLVRNPSNFEEVEQLIWLRVFEKRAYYDPEWEFHKWLLRLSLFVAFNYARHQMARSHLTNRTDLDNIMDYRDQTDVLLVAEIQETVRRAVDDLPENERVAITLIDLHQTEKVRGPHRWGRVRGRIRLQTTLRSFYHGI